MNSRKLTYHEVVELTEVWNRRLEMNGLEPESPNSTTISPQIFNISNRKSVEEIDLTNKNLSNRDQYILSRHNEGASPRKIAKELKQLYAKQAIEKSAIHSLITKHRGKQHGL